MFDITPLAYYISASEQFVNYLLASGFRRPGNRGSAASDSAADPAAADDDAVSGAAADDDAADDDGPGSV